MINEVVTQQIIDLLNEVNKLDSKALKELIELRVECNDALANHPSIQCRFGSNEKNYVRLLGFLNGLSGTDDRGFGGVTMVLGDHGDILEFKRTDVK